MNLESNGVAKADSSIWEVHDANKKHFAYTTLAAARGFCDLAGMSAKAQKGDPAKWRTLAKKVQTAFLKLDQSPAKAEILDLFGARKFIPTRAENYQDTERIARELGLLNR